MKYARWTGGDCDEAAAQSLCAAGYPMLLSQLLSVRGVSSPEEAALALGRPVKTVYTQLSRGKKLLREALERSGRHGIP